MALFIIVLKLMIKKLALTFLPIARLRAPLPINNVTTRYILPKQTYLFTTEKTKSDNPQSHAQTRKNKNQNEEKQNGKNVKKLSELTNQELIDLNTEQSIKLVHQNIKKMEEIRSKQQEQIKEFTERISFMQKSHSESANKEQQLLQNIKLQEQELQRIKKRADKQIQDSKDFAISKLAKQLLQVADCIKRCKQLAEEKAKTDPNDQYLNKIIDLDRQMKQFLKLYEIEQFDPINQVFDPNTSQGLVTIPTPPGYQKNKVATTMMTGYKIKSRLLRSAKVGIFI